MEKAPLNDPIFKQDSTSRINSHSWVQWLTKLATESGVFPHASSHAANGSDPITLSQSQITDLTTDLANKALKNITITAGAGLLGGGNLSSNFSIYANVGTSANTLAAGDDTRILNISNKADKSITVTAGNGLTGGGNLSANFSIGANIGNSAGTLAAGDDSRFSNLANHVANTSIHFPGALLAITVLSNASGNFTPANGTNALYIEMVGGGGGGGGATASAGQTGVATGGGGGGGLKKYIANVEANYTYTVGSGGGGGAAGANPGNNGGNTTFVGVSLGTLTAPGGIAGVAGLGTPTVAKISETATSPTAVSGGDINLSGGAGGTAIAASLTSITGGRGGISIFSEGTRCTRGTETGIAGSGNGGGGSGGSSQAGGNVAGGNGSNGVIYVWQFK